MGGPVNKYGEGWYSEIIGPGDTVEFSDNSQIFDYFFRIFPSSDFYRECFVPAFYLDVPLEWKSKS